MANDKPIHQGNANHGVRQSFGCVDALISVLFEVGLACWGSRALSDSWFRKPKKYVWSYLMTAGSSRPSNPWCNENGLSICWHQSLSCELMDLWRTRVCGLWSWTEFERSWWLLSTVKSQERCSGSGSSHSWCTENSLSVWALITEVTWDQPPATLRGFPSWIRISGLVTR